MAHISSIAGLASVNMELANGCPPFKRMFGAGESQGLLECSTMNSCQLGLAVVTIPITPISH